MSDRLLSDGYRSYLSIYHNKTSYTPSGYNQKRDLSHAAKTPFSKSESNSLDRTYALDLQEMLPELHDLKCDNAKSTSFWMC